MSTITIPAREVKAGDVIDFGGLTAVVTDVTIGAHVAIRIKLPSDKEGGWWHRLALDELLTVTRPDPDAELVEVMARAIRESILSDSYPTNGDSQEKLEHNARAALAAARKAGLL